MGGLKSWGRSSPRDAMALAFRHADLEVRDHAEKHMECFGMGTTLAAVMLDNRAALIGHVGDSRVYLLRAGKLHQLTKDHGVGNMITRAIGVGPGSSPDLDVIDLEPNDVLLLCTDGLTRCARTATIRNIRRETHSLRIAWTSCTEANR